MHLPQNLRHAVRILVHGLAVCRQLGAAPRQPRGPPPGHPHGGGIAEVHEVYHSLRLDWILHDGSDDGQPLRVNLTQRKELSVEENNISCGITHTSHAFSVSLSKAIFPLYCMCKRSNLASFHEWALLRLLLLYAGYKLPRAPDQNWNDESSYNKQLDTNCCGCNCIQSM